MAGMSPTAESVSLEFAVIIPAYNVEATLAEQLTALVAQTWTGRWGIVVVNNRSTDGTRAVALRYRDFGVRVVDAEHGQGVAYARNAGVEAITASTFAFCDGDDVVHPGWVAAMADALRSADVVSGPLETDSLNPSWLSRTRPMGTANGLPTFGRLGFASGCNSGMTREVFDLAGGYDEDFVGLEDIEFSLRLIASGTDIEFVPDALIAYRYRTRLQDVWRQGVYYGRGRPDLKRLAKRLGLPVPSVFESLKSWGWLVLHLPELRTRPGRYRLTWVLANRVGVLQGYLVARRNHLISGLVRMRRDCND